MLTIKSANDYKYTVRIMFNGDVKFPGQSNNIFTDDYKFGPVVQFFCEHPTDKTKLGTMISSYYISSLLETDWENGKDGLGLCGYYPDMIILNSDMNKIIDFCLQNERVKEELLEIKRS